MLYEPLLKSQLARVAKVFLAATKRAPATIGRKYAADSRFFERVLEQGGGFTARTYDLVICGLSEDWPDDLKWPEEVPRPTPRQVNSVLARVAREKRARAA